MRLLLDMNLTPEWVDVLTEAGYDTVHWRSVGDPRAPDETIWDYAIEHELVIVTHDLDFGERLALTNAVAPSVVQLRSRGTFPMDAANALTRSLSRCELELESGALLVVDVAKERLRLLPLDAR